MNYTLHEGVGERWTNLLLGIILLTFGISVHVHRGYSSNVEPFRSLAFLFCFDEREMRINHLLNERRARDQVNAQRTFKKLSWYWYGFYMINIAWFIWTFAMKNPNTYTGFALVGKTIWYLLLFLAQETAVLRSFLVLGQFEIAALYLHNHLQTLMDRVEKTSLPEMSRIGLNRFAMRILFEYNQIVSKQKKINTHCERCFYVYFLYTSFTLAFPIVILFEDKSEIFLITFNVISYLTMIFILFGPPILFNSQYLMRSVSSVKHSLLLRSCGLNGTPRNSGPKSTNFLINLLKILLHLCTI